MKNKAFRILLDAGVLTKSDLIYALRESMYLELWDGPWAGSDYFGDEISESNQRSLARDYPNLLHGYNIPYGHCEYGLRIDPREFGKREALEEATEVASILARLKLEYPVYDEEDTSAIVNERAESAWGAYLRMSLQAEIYTLVGEMICLDDAEDAFWNLVSEHEIVIEAEGHRDVTFQGIYDREFLLDLAKAAIAEGGLVDAWVLTDLTEDGYLLVGAWMAEGYEWVHPNQLALFAA